LEYVTLTGNVSRYLRRGVDTRVSMTRTLYQQSDRVIEYRDSLGALDSSRSISHFHIDTWYGSVNVSPVPYVKTAANVSLSRDSHPTTADRRYQMTGTLDARLAMTSKLEGRFGYTSNYLGERLRLGHAFSDNVNLGLSWLPRNNLNLSLTYIYTTYNTTVTNSNGNFNAYVSYFYRKAFSCYLSYGEREQKQGVASPLPGQPSVATSRPQNVTAQLLVYLSPRSTLTLAYTKNRGDASTVGGGRLTESFQGIVNLQI
jgi:hypothetical protein